ncbi:hypothetical protein QBC98_007021 [Kitasatospora acidiphila]
MVSGPPGSGKSLLAQRIASRACLPVISRDSLKGGVCFTHGGVPERIAALAAEPFWATLSSLSSAGVSLVAEWALRRSMVEEHLPALGALADLRLVQCTAPREVLIDRIKGRLSADPDIRWPFPDAQVIAELADGSFPLDDFTVTDKVPAALTVDTTDFRGPDLTEILRFCFGGGDSRVAAPAPRRVTDSTSTDLEGEDAVA